MAEIWIFFKNPRWPPLFQDGRHFFKITYPPYERFPESFMKIRLDLAKIFMELKNFDWHDGKGKKGKEGEEEPYYFVMV